MRPLDRGGGYLRFNRIDSYKTPTITTGSDCRAIAGETPPRPFSVNCGIVEYVDWANHRVNGTRLPNPIMHTYLKDRAQFAEERELRISLSALGIGRFRPGRPD